MVATCAAEGEGRAAKRADMESLLAARKVCALAAKMRSNVSEEKQVDSDSRPTVNLEATDSSLSS